MKKIIAVVTVVAVLLLIALAGSGLIHPRAVIRKFDRRAQLLEPLLELARKEEQYQKSFESVSWNLNGVDNPALDEPVRIPLGEPLQVSSSVVLPDGTEEFKPLTSLRFTVQSLDRGTFVSAVSQDYRNEAIEIDGTTCRFSYAMGYPADIVDAGIFGLVIKVKVNGEYYCLATAMVELNKAKRDE